jgi:hypothetical protein
VRDHLEARALARAKVRARRRRAATIRRRTAWFSVAVFAIAWVVIFGQLVGGHDPALARKRVVASDPRVRATPVRRPRSEPRAHRRHRHHRHHSVASAAVTSKAAPPVTTQAAAPPPVTTQAAAPPPAPAPAPPPPTPVTTQQS